MTIKKAAMIMGLAIVAVLAAYALSPTFRGFVQTGGRALPSPETQA